MTWTFKSQLTDIFAEVEGVTLEIDNFRKGKKNAQANYAQALKKLG